MWYFYNVIWSIWHDKRKKVFEGHPSPCHLQLSSYIVFWWQTFVTLAKKSLIYDWQETLGQIFGEYFQVRLKYASHKFPILSDCDIDNEICKHIHQKTSFRGGWQQNSFDNCSGAARLLFHLGANIWQLLIQFASIIICGNWQFCTLCLIFSSSNISTYNVHPFGLSNELKRFGGRFGIKATYTENLEHNFHGKTELNRHYLTEKDFR